jgi:hypothetical protein
VRVDVNVPRERVLAMSVRGLSDVDDVTPFEHDGAVNEFGEGSDLVEDDYDRRPLLFDVGEDLGEYVLTGQVDPGEGFVEDEEIGLADHGSGNEDPLLLTSAQGGHILEGEVGQADRVERLNGASTATPGGYEATIVEQARGDDFESARRDPPGGGDSLWDVTQAFPWCVGGKDPVDLDAAREGRDDSQNRPYGRCLSRAISTHEGEDLACGDVERHSVDDGMAPERHVKVGDADCWGRASHSPTLL